MPAATAAYYCYLLPAAAANAIATSMLSHRVELATIFVLSVVAFAITYSSIPRAMEVLFEKGIFGIDINKRTMEERASFGQTKRNGGPEALGKLRSVAVPESLGIVVGAIYLSVVVVTLIVTSGVPALLSTDAVSRLTSGSDIREVKEAVFFDPAAEAKSSSAVLTPSSPSSSATNTTSFTAVHLSMANAAINTIAVMLLLGFVDDVLDVRWRHKIVLSIVGALPLILSYTGPLSIAVPSVLQPWLAGATYLYLGPLYLLYMALFCVFCANSINILAGINGVEVGQCLVIGLASIGHNLIQLRHGGATARNQLLSLMLLVPFVATSMALWCYNRYPSRVFVGDSYTYFAGTVLAVAGISGTYTKTLTLFFAPQLINFFLSVPQLFHIVPCPRHRVPTYNPKTGKLSNSRNYTILNAILFVTGDLHERTLTYVLLSFQAFCCIVAFGVRYYGASLMYETVV